MIEGIKVSLRLVEEGDLQVLHRYLCEVDNPGPYYPNAIEPMCGLRARFLENGFWAANEGRMVVIDRGGRIVGWVIYFKPHPVLETNELAYVIFDRESRNKGYATEAVAMFLRLLFRTTPVHRIEANIATDNVASRRVAEKCGFLCEGVAREVWFSTELGRYIDGARYAILRRDVS